MTEAPPPGPGPEPGSDEEPDQEPRPGSLRPITARALTTSIVVGLLAGWGWPRIAVRVTGEAPMVSWVQPLALVLVAGIMAFLAWHTWRTVHQLGRRLEVQHAVNRLVLARACALAGALVGGGYVGLAVSWLGDASQRADQWILRSVVAALAAAAVTGASVALERACRAPGDVPPP